MIEALILTTGGAIAYLIGRGVGRMIGRDESANTVLIVRLHQDTLGVISLAGVTLVPNATHITTTKDEP